MDKDDSSAGSLDPSLPTPDTHQHEHKNNTTEYVSNPQHGAAADGEEAYSAPAAPPNTTPPSATNGATAPATNLKGKMSARWRKAVTAVNVARAFRTAADAETPAEKLQNLRQNMRRTMSRRPNIDDDFDDGLVSPSDAYGGVNGAASDEPVLDPDTADLLLATTAQSRASVIGSNSPHGPSSPGPTLDSTTSSMGSSTSPSIGVSAPNNAVTIIGADQMPTTATSHLGVRQSNAAMTRRSTVADVAASRKSIKLDARVPSVDDLATTAPTQLVSNIFSCVSCRRAITIEPFAVCHFVPPQLTLNPSKDTFSTVDLANHEGPSSVSADGPVESASFAVKYSSAKAALLPVGTAPLPDALQSKTLCVRYAEDLNNKNGAASGGSSEASPDAGGKANAKSTNPAVAWQETVRMIDGYGRGTINAMVIDTSAKAKSARSASTGNKVPINLTFWRKRQQIQVTPRDDDTPPSVSNPESPLFHAPFTIDPAQMIELRAAYRKRATLFAAVAKPAIVNHRSNFGVAAQSILCDVATGVDITPCISGTGAALSLDRTHIVKKAAAAVVPIATQVGDEPAAIAGPQLTATNWAGQQTSHLPATSLTVVGNPIAADGSSMAGIPQLAVVRPAKAATSSFFAASASSTAGNNSAPPYSSGYHIDRSILPDDLDYDPAHVTPSGGNSGFREAAVSMAVLTRGSRCNPDLLKESAAALQIESTLCDKGHSSKYPKSAGLNGGANLSIITKSPVRSASPLSSSSAVAITPTLGLKNNATNRMQRKRMLALYETISEQAGGVDLPLCAACTAERSLALQSAIANVRKKMQTLTEHLQSFEQMAALEAAKKAGTAPAGPIPSDCEEARAISILLLGAGGQSKDASTQQSPSSPSIDSPAQLVVDAEKRQRLGQLDREIDGLHRELQALLIQEKSELDVTESLMIKQSIIALNSRKQEAYTSEGDRWRANGFHRTEHTLNTESLLMRAFRFELHGSIAMINDLRVGKHPTSFFQQATESQVVSNEEINCGCGFLIQLVLLLAARRKITSFTKPVRLIYRGSQSVIEMRSNSGKTETFDFFINTKLFSWNTFGSAWVAFASCVADLVAHLERRVGEIRRENPGISGLRSVPSLPINNEMVGGYSIKYGVTSDDNWTIAVRHIMILLHWCVTVEGQV